MTIDGLAKELTEQVVAGHAGTEELQIDLDGTLLSIESVGLVSNLETGKDQVVLVAKQ